MSGVGQEEDKKPVDQGAHINLKVKGQMAAVATVCHPSSTEFMVLALEQAKFAFNNLEVPIGCVIVEDDVVIASGSNRTTEMRNATRHAEMEAIDFLLDKWQNDGLNQMQVGEKFSRCDLYVTCEPCIMCATALSILGIREVYYGCANDKFGGCGSILSLHQTDSEKLFRGGILQGKGFKCTGGLMSQEAVSLLRSFYEQGNPNGIAIVEFQHAGMRREMQHLTASSSFILESTVIGLQSVFMRATHLLFRMVYGIIYPV